VETVNKVQEGAPHIVDAIQAGAIAMVINTTDGAQSVADSFPIRRSALECRVPYFTTIAAADVAAKGIARLRQRLLNVRPLQEYHSEGY
jgi:carbamoyl-phosphate synthase large subunit